MRRELTMLMLLASSLFGGYAQSPLLKSYKVPTTIDVGRKKIVDIPANASADKIQEIINQAVAQSSSSSTTEIRFAANATYNVSREGVGTPIVRVVTFKGVKPQNIVIDGRGAKFIVGSQSRFMMLNRAQNVIVKNLTVDYDIKYIANAKVVSGNPATNEYIFELQSPSFYNITPSYDNAQYRWALVMEQLEDGTWGVVPDHPAQIYVLGKSEHLGGNRFKIKLRSSCDHGRWHGAVKGDKWLERMLTKGQMVAFTARRDAINIFNVGVCRNVTLRDIDILHSPAAVASDNNSYLTSYYNINVKPAEGEIFATTADGLYVTNQRSGPWIERCNLRGLGDDAIVVKNSISHYAGRSDNPKLPYKIVAGKRRQVEFLEGDQVDFFDMNSRQLISSHRVVASSSREFATQVSVALDPAITDPRIVPDNEMLWIYNRSNQCNGFVIKDCTFADHRRWGVLCSGADGSIVGNHFLRSQNTAVYMVNSDNYEKNTTGAPPRNIEVRDNIFERCWEGINYTPYGVVSTRINGVLQSTRAELVEGDDPDDWNGVENITIVNNLFKNYHTSTELPNDESTAIYAIDIRDANGVVIKGNRVFVEGEQLTEQSAFSVVDSQGVEVRDNRFNTLE